MNDTTLDAYNEIYVTNISQRVFNSMGIDFNFGISTENFEKGLRRANSNNEVLVLYAHKIDSTPANYRISQEYLEKLFILSNQYQLKSIRMSDLKEFF